MSSIMPAMKLSSDQIQHANTLLCGRGCAAIPDSGTSLIAAPSFAMRGLEILLPKLHANCSNFEELPDLEVVLGGHRLFLPPEAYTIRLRGTYAEKEQASNLLHFKAERHSADHNADECMYGFMDVDR